MCADELSEVVMDRSSAESDVFHGKSSSAALLVTTDARLFADLQVIFQQFGVALTPVNSAREAVAMIQTIGDADYLLLDARMRAVDDGSLLETLSEWNRYRRGAIAAIATRPDDKWIERLEHGVIDDIVALSADASTWRARLSTIQRNRKMHVELEELRAAAQAELERDPVTGAFSREMVLKLLFRETDRVQRLRGELSLMLFALEGFERWTEELGRQVCDGLLREVAARAGRALRSYDLLGRVGEHEFLVALPGSTPASAQALAERLRIEVFGQLFLVRSERGDFVGVNLTATFAVTPSRGRSPLVVLHETEGVLQKARCSARGSKPASQSSHDEETGEIAKSRKALYLPHVGLRAERGGFHGLG